MPFILTLNKGLNIILKQSNIKIAHTNSNLLKCLKAIKERNLNRESITSIVETAIKNMLGKSEK